MEQKNNGVNRDRTGDLLIIRFHMKLQSDELPTAPSPQLLKSGPKYGYKSLPFRIANLLGVLGFGVLTKSMHAVTWTNTVAIFYRHHIHTSKIQQNMYSPALQIRLLGNRALQLARLQRRTHIADSPFLHGGLSLDHQISRYSFMYNGAEEESLTSTVHVPIWGTRSTFGLRTSPGWILGSSSKTSRPAE